MSSPTEKQPLRDRRRQSTNPFDSPEHVRTALSVSFHELLEYQQNFVVGGLGDEDELFHDALEDHDYDYDQDDGEILGEAFLDEEDDNLIPLDYIITTEDLKRPSKKRDQTVSTETETSSLDQAEFVSPFELALAEWTKAAVAPTANDKFDFNGFNRNVRQGFNDSYGSMDAVHLSKRDHENHRTSSASELQRTPDTKPGLAADERRDSTSRSNSIIHSTSRVLATLGSHSGGVTEMDEAYDHRGTPWTKLILLEEFGTASSWAILLIPYIAFALCLVLDTASSLEGQYVGPLYATDSCLGVGSRTDYNRNTELLRSADGPCHYSFEIGGDDYGILAHQLSNHAFQSAGYRTFMSTGIAFTTGSISDVPPTSPFLRGDAKFDNLTKDALELVANGMVITSTVVLQRSHQDEDDASRCAWVPVSISRPERLSMACNPIVGDKGKYNEPLQWSCSSPRIVDVVLAMPGTSLLTGDDIQVNVLYTVHQDLEESFASLVSMNDGGSHSLMEQPYSNSSSQEARELLRKVVVSSSYVMEHESSVYALLSVVVRSTTLLLTLIFTLAWCWCFGSAGWRSCCFWKFWWESPWTLFPERIYILFLLCSLLLMQNPMLVYAHFHHEVYGNAQFRSAVDAIIGIGVNFHLMLWLCLFHGLRYHTAEIARRRAKQQRHVLELRRTARYVAQHEEKSTRDTEEFDIEEYVLNYYEQFGDVDGTGVSGTLDIRVKHDPFGEHWADFLLPKFFLLLLGMAAVFISSAYRFPSKETAVVLRETVQHYNVIYVASTFAVFFILLLWIVLILRHAVRTGRKLRKEPFLSTRPAQLAYRILLGILVLAMGALLVPFFADLFNFITKWSLGPGNRAGIGSLQLGAAGGSTNNMDFLLPVLIHVTERFPYSGTATSIGPGKIFFSMVCSFIAAIIFLPSRSFMYGPTNRPLDKNNETIFSAMTLTERGRRRRDKRVLVTLARHTHTWQVFPLPIKRLETPNSLLSDISFNIDAGENSIAFFGKYTPVFCLETACWLLEASWQAYYSPRNFSLEDFAPGRMTLENIGLRLERAIFDEATQTQAFIASNCAAQVDGEEDSIIVVSFRGTANARNMSIDLKLRQVPLLDQMIGIGDRPLFHVSADGVDATADHEWFWDTPMGEPDKVVSVSPVKSSEGCLAWHWQKPQPNNNSVSGSVKNLLRTTPFTSQAFPCVHQGFLEAYSHIRRQLWEAVLEVLQRQLSKAVQRALGDPEMSTSTSLSLPKIYITGHSLGGSLGQLLAFDLASNCDLFVEFDNPIQTADDEVFGMPMMESPHGAEPAVFFSPARSAPASDCVASEEDFGNRRSLQLKPPIAVYTYGQPRVGNHAFARLYKERVPHTFRVVNEGDAFTILPNSFQCGGLYKHAGLEVMLDEGRTGNILVGPTVVETMFRFTKVRTSLAAHSMERYRDCLERGLTEDELQEYYRTRGMHHQQPKTDESDSNQNVPASVPSAMPLPEWLTRKMPRKKSEDS